MSYHGTYNVVNKDKYIGNPVIKWRSLWEKQYAKFCDNSHSVLRWSYETVHIKYYDPVKHRVRTYIMDFYVETIDDTFLIEIKPASQTIKPVKPKTRKGQKRFIKEILTFQTNLAKWTAAKKFAIKHGMQFKILDEFSLGIKKKPTKKNSRKNK